jgi:methionyl aminopeptidase
MLYWQTPKETFVMAVSVNHSNKISRKSRHDIKLMRKAGQIVAEVHALCREHAKAGVTTAFLDRMAEEHIRKSGASPTFKGYHGFPFTICASVNEQVVHGFPSETQILKEGDVISVDVGATYQGMVADAALTIAVGEISADVQRLLDCTEKALYNAIAKARSGNFLEDVSGAVEDTNLEYGFGLVKQYGGHSVGYVLHEEPFIHNYRSGNRGPELKSGNCLAIEPMFTMGSDEVYTLEDQWTVVTKDGLPAAHFEHTVAITDGEADILTRLQPVV